MEEMNKVLYDYVTKHNVDGEIGCVLFDWCKAYEDSLTNKTNIKYLVRWCNSNDIDKSFEESFDDILDASRSFNEHKENTEVCSVEMWENHGKNNLGNHKTAVLLNSWDE